MKRGEIAIANLRPHDPRAKVRPVLIAQNDADNARMTNTIVVMITGNTRRAAEPTQHLVDPSHPDWARSGLHVPSVINCSNIFTIEQSYVSKIIGTLSQQTMLSIDDCLRRSLGL
jgi:mRNA-degrading endonuclease toxin of MazEF toxin-antitoxin module